MAGCCRLLVLSCVCATLLTGAIGAGPSAAQDGVMSSGGSLSSGEGSPFFSAHGPGDSAAGREQMRRLGEEMRREEQARERARSTPEAGAERARSRSAHRGKGNRAAVELLRAEFSAQLRPSVPDAETLLAGDRVGQFFSDYAAVLEGSDGRPARLIDSQVALRVPGSATSDGGGELVDLDLVPRGSGFAPENGLVDVQVPSEAADGIEVGPVRVLPDGQAGVERVDANTLAYPNIDTDTDLAVNPTLTGFETFHQLRSPDAPEVQRLRLELPSGSSLRSTEVGGAEVVRDGRLMLGIAAPAAVDAQGRSVPASYEIDGDVLAIRTPHRDGELAYPVLVDPEFEVKEDWACGWGSANCTATWFHGHGFALDGLSHWQWYENQSGVFGPHKHCFNYGWMNNCYGPAHGGGPNWNLGGGSDGRRSVGQTGLHVLLYPNTWYAPWALGEWYYVTPGQTTQVYRADFGAKFLRKRYSGTNPVLFTGVWSYGTNTWASVANHYGGYEPNDPHGGLTHHWNAAFGGADRPGPQAVAFGFSNSTGAATPTPNVYRNAYMGAAIIQLTDPEAPTISRVDPVGPTGWTRDGTWTFSPEASDRGLGVRRIRLSVPLANGTTRTEDRGVWCNGTKGLPCPSSHAVPNANQPSFTVRAADLPNGPVPVTIKAADALGAGTDQSGRQHESSVTRTVRVDRTGPMLTNLRGSLYERRNQSTDHRREGLYGDRTDFSASISDAHSGVDRAHLAIDRDRDGTFTASEESAHATCSAGGCDPLTYDFETSALPDGDYSVRLLAVDRVGNLSEQRWQVTIDRRGDIYHAGEYTTDRVQTVEEWARIGTETARSQTDENIATRRPVPCQDDEPDGPKCDEVRERSRLGESDPAKDDTYSVTRGTSENDPKLATIATILEPAELTETDRISAGPIESAVPSWQTLPPAHGATYDLYRSTEVADHGVPPDSSDGEAVERRDVTTTVDLWIDGTTKMPLRAWVRNSDGDAAEYFYSYDRSRKALGDYPEDFFLIDRPERLAQEERTEYRDDGELGPQTDRETGQEFSAWDLGVAPTLASVPLCRVTTMRNTLDEPGADSIYDPASDPEQDAATFEPAPHPFGPETVVDTEYIGAGDGCAVLGAALDEASVTISTAARGSSTAAAWRAGYKEAGTAIEADVLDPSRETAGLVLAIFGSPPVPTPVYIVPVDYTGTVKINGILLETETETITVTGPIGKSDVQELVNALQPR